MVMMSTIITGINVVVVIIIDLEQPQNHKYEVLIVHNKTYEHNYKISTLPTRDYTHRANLGFEGQQKFPKPRFSISLGLASHNIFQERKPQSWQESTIFISQIFMFFKAVLLLH